MRKVIPLRRPALHHGEALSVLVSLPSESVDAVITDPPYSSGGMFRGDRTAPTRAKYVQTGAKVAHPNFSGDSRDQRSFRYWETLWLSECLRISKGGGIVAVFTDWRQLPITTDAVQAAGWTWRGIVVWDKGYGRPTLGRFSSACEFVVWGTSGPRALGGDSPAGIVRASPPVGADKPRSRKRSWGTCSE